MFEIAYNSDLMIGDPSELSTLAIFYDRVLLPCTSFASSRKWVEFERSESKFRMSGYDFSGVTLETESGLVVIDDRVSNWDIDNEILFQEGVLARLPEPSPHCDLLASWLDGERSLDPSVSSLLYDPCAPTVASATRPFLYVRHDHLRHLLRTDLTLPALFRSTAEPNRDVLKALQAHETFKYLVPRLASLPPDEILKVRERVSDTREGFSMHLQCLSADVEARLHGGESLTDIARHARSVVETTLIPDYREFVRQIHAERSGFWLRVLDAARRVFEIEVAPWTPKFYGDMLAAIGMTFLTSQDARKEALTNKAQAYQFMQSVERAELSHAG